MKYSKEEILKALELIQDICGGTGCHDCPFGNEDETCMMKTMSPYEWELNTPDNITWRAFR